MNDRIENMEQLVATLAYLEKMANFLEGLRQYENDTDKNTFVTAGSYPVHELRKNLALAREFAERETTAQPANGVYTNGHAIPATPKVPVGV